MKIVVRDRNVEFITEMKSMIAVHHAAIPDHVEITTELGDIFEHWDSYERDIALVSPANSFGFMNGGIDQVYINKFGQELEDRVREDIKQKTAYNELIIGQSLVVPLRLDSESGQRIQAVSDWLIVSPTMRVPQRILDATDVYLATRSATKQSHRNGFKTMLIPGMGIGVGGVHPTLGARNMLMGMIDGVNVPKVYNSCAESFLDAQKYNW